MAMKEVAAQVAAQCTHNSGHLHAGWLRHSASPPTPTAAAVITERR